VEEEKKGKGKGKEKKQQSITILQRANKGKMTKLRPFSYMLQSCSLS
jgi:hypothetical protein